MKIISFVVIAYNEERSIGCCLKSIQKQDGLFDYEIVVVNDGSKDSTAKVVSQFAKKNQKIKLLTLPTNQGRGAAREAGVRAAVGKYIAFVDSDIVLPNNWFTTCISYMDRYDAVGGVAVPDGDVNYVYVKFNLIPKKVAHSTTVTGSNGLYRREIFDSVVFDRNYRDGEDFVFNNNLKEKNFKLHSVTSLVVDHRESKSFREAMKWLFQIGMGSSRLLKQFGKVRLPDLTFFGLLTTLVLSLLFSYFFHLYLLILLIPFYVVFISILHLCTKFYLQLNNVLPFFSAVLVNSLLLSSYYLGRIVGFFTTKISKSIVVKKVMICFDFEGKWGMPYKSRYDIVKTTTRLLGVLDKYNAKATFFVVGKIIEEHPELIKEIAGQGHEIATHGYTHENLSKLTQEELVTFSKNLFRIERFLEKLIGKRPVGFRSPYLMSPSFYTNTLYRILEDHGYKWVSNREIRYPEELFRPDRLRLPSLWGKNNLLTKVLFIFLNTRLLITETAHNKGVFSRIIFNIKWLNRGAEPFKRGNLIEIPLYSPLDCDLLGLPKPETATSNEWVRYASACLVAGLNRRGNYYMLNFHDWIIGSANRVSILENILKLLTTDKNNKIVTATNLMKIANK